METFNSEMFDIMSMINIFLGVTAMGLLLGGFKRYNNVPIYRNLGVGFVVSIVITILVQIHTLILPNVREWYLKLSITGWCITAILFYLFIFKNKNNA